MKQFQAGHKDYNFKIAFIFRIFLEYYSEKLKKNFFGMKRCLCFHLQAKLFKVVEKASICFLFREILQK